ncbi:MAG: hypothetical protein IKI10_01370 [Muribaculaceae bacterium]|nr:hypothetical protein [Muribaculaceae bacterium]
MKKFLFTLAALLMAGSLCAEEYFYIEDFQVSQELLSQTAARNRRMTIPVKAHFDAYVNSWQVDLSSTEDDEGLNQLPGGVTIYSATDGPGMTVPYMNDMCEEVSAVLNIGKAQNNTRIIGAFGLQQGYWFEPGMDPDNDDPVCYGGVKWFGDYECMFNLVFQFPQDFTGCDIWVKTQPASGKDTRGPITDGTKSFHKFTISVEGSTPTPADKPVITVNNDNTTAVSFTIAGEEGATIYYKYGNMTEYAVYTGEVTETVEGTYTVEAYAVGPNGKTESEHATENFTVVAPAPVPADKPVITVNNDNTTAVSFTIAGEEGATIYYKYGNMTEYAVYNGEVTETVEGNYTVEAYAVGPNGKIESEHATENFTVVAPTPDQAQKPVITVLNDNTTDVTVEIAAEEGATVMYQVTEAGAKAYAAYDGPMHFTTPGTYTIEAYAEGPNGKTESDHDSKTFTVKAPDQPSQAGDIEVVVTPTTYEVTPTGNEAQLIVDGVVVNAPYVVDRPAYGQDDINVTVTVRTDDGDGFYPVETPVTFVVKAQLPQPNIVATPGKASEDEGHTNQVDGHYYDVTFEAPAGYTVHYIINGPNGAHFEGNWVAGDDPIHVTADGTYSVEAYTVDGEDKSTSDTETFVISPKTGVNELINGKTVASQRFFNLAGQEMTEANGVTIVVTTYTDGTTSAVKVMK